MAGLDVDRLKRAQEELEKKSNSSSKNWIQMSKIEEPIEVRIMDPLPEMDGLYYLEVPVWWVNGTRVISPSLMGEPDVIKMAIAEARGQRDPGMLKLIEAKGENGMKKLQEATEYWVPVLQFEWEFDKKENIVGIYDEKGNPDPELIRKFIVDERVKMLVSKITVLKDINRVATSRGGGLMTDPTKGFNFQITKSGAKRDTKYTVMRTADVIPIPEDFYAPPKMVDPLLIAQALMFTDEYMDKIIGKYLYNETLPDLTDECYRYPELRAEMKSRFEDADAEPKEEAPRRRPSAPAEEPARRAAAPAATTEEPEDDAPLRNPPPAAATRGRGTPAPAATRSRPAATEPPPSRPAGRRNLLNDIQD